ncbi:hypothetical protein HK097_001583 [Rhizophlyctis rosea]|uniref:CCR4-NOT transcription complex subunit 10 n=1 Tax=Rhizophlyctis rosea TaxID=64517 RepID=A0AAD5S488_9FUNG|nr:hypothetical protein HK097_001583 [Rhizophlyctis rosea]
MIVDGGGRLAIQNSLLGGDSLMPSQQDDAARIACEAAIAFRAQKYDQAVTALKRLSELRGPSDPRVQHNLAVAGYYAGTTVETANPETATAPFPLQLLSTLENVLTLPSPHFEPLRSASPENRETSPYPSDPLLSSTTPEPTDVHALSPSPTGPDSDTESPTASIPSVLDNPTVLYNRATTLFHLAHYNASCNALDPILQTIETVDAYLAVRSCLLAAECRLAVSQPEQALSIASVMERAFILRNPTNGGEPDQSLTGTGDSRALFDSLAASSASAHMNLSDHSDAADNQHSRFTPSPDRFDERWSRESDGGSDSAMTSPLRKGRLSNGFAATAVDVSAADDAPPAPSVDEALAYYGGSIRAAVAMIRARAYLAKGDVMSAVAQVESGRQTLQSEASDLEDKADSDSPSKPSHDPFAYISAQIASKNLPTLDSIAMLNTARHQTATPSWADHVGETQIDDFVARWDEKYYLNNLGNLHYRSGRHAAAAMCFAEALKVNDGQLDRLTGVGLGVEEEEEEEEEWEQHLEEEERVKPVVKDVKRPPALLRYVLDTTAPTLYNTGLQLMIMQKYEEAYDCFERAVNWAEARGVERMVGGTGAGDVGGAGPPGVPWALIWLRMGECCVRRYEAVRTSHKPVTPPIISLGGYRLVISNPRQPRNDAQPSANHNPDYLNLDMARRCYENALAAADGEHEDKHPDSVVVRTAALVGLGYVFLRKGMPLVALAVVGEVGRAEVGKSGAEGVGLGGVGRVEIEGGDAVSGSGRYGDDLENLRYVARIYATRALGLLSRPSESAPYLHINPTSADLRTVTAFAKASTLCAAAERNEADPVGVNLAADEVTRCAEGAQALTGEARDVLKGLMGWVALAKGDRVAAAKVFGN